MSSTGQIQLTLQALEELIPEMQGTHVSPSPALPSIQETLDELGPLPHEALFLGIASDGLPVLLNLNEPTPGPLLIAGEIGSGKTMFLQVVVQAVAHMHTARHVQFGVISSYPENWEGYRKLPHCLGVFPASHNSLMDFLLALVSWAHANKGGEQAVLLLLEDLDCMTEADFDVLQNLRWLFLRGPSHRIWPLVTLNAERCEKVLPWLEAFHTRIFGRIQDSRIAGELTQNPGNELSNLLSGAQFALRESSRWLKFWIPTPEK